MAEKFKPTMGELRFVTKKISGITDQDERDFEQSFYLAVAAVRREEGVTLKDAEKRVENMDQDDLAELLGVELEDEDAGES